MSYGSYQCPVCEIKMERELITFLNHTNRHITERIREMHPGQRLEGDAFVFQDVAFRLPITV